MKFYLHPQAEAELVYAIYYYENCEYGLGLEFAEEVYSTISRIIQYPNACTKLSTNTRRGLVNRFPYGVIFQIQSETVRVIAVANLHKRPNYWNKRI